MNPKPFIFIGMFVGSIVGSFIPALWHAGIFSLWSIVFSAIGALVGIYYGWKLSRYN